METKCPKCGTDCAADGLCPKCVVEMAEHPTGEPVEELPLTPGQPFRGLEVLELVGRGGMGVVYKARQPHLDRPVALKVLPRRLASDPEFRERFGREARALAGLAHPHIVGVYDFGFEGDLAFLVMEFVDGANLRAILRDRKLAPQEAIAIVPQLCDALQYAHGEGVVHRDVKPENILLDKKGRVKIADFGLAKIVGGAMTRLDTITKSNMAMGTPHYMAPEQIERPKEVDHRADIYSMGVVFYEMLTGELPIGKFEPPSRKVEIDVRLDDVVLKTLEKAPERRYQQVSEVKEAVTRITERPAERAPRGAGVWRVVALVAALLAVTFGIILLKTGKEIPAPTAVQPNPRIPELRKRLAEVQEELSRLSEVCAPGAPKFIEECKEYDRLEGELARLEGRAPRPYEVPKQPGLRLEDVVLSAKDLPSGYAWADASQDIVESNRAIVLGGGDPLWQLHANRDYTFWLCNVRVHALECADEKSAHDVAVNCKVKLQAGTVEVLEKDRLVVATWFEGDPAVESTRLYDALVDRVREKMGLAAVDRLTGAAFGLSQADFFRNRRGGTSPLQDLVFDPKRPRLYVSDSGTGSVLVFSTDELRLIGEIPVGKQPQGMDISPDDRLAVAVAGDRHVAILDLESGKIVKKIEGRDVPYSVRFSRAKDALAVAYVDDPGTGEVEPTRLKLLGEVEKTESLAAGYPLILCDETNADPLWVVVGRGGEESEYVVTNFRTPLRWSGPAVTDATMPRSAELLVTRRDRPEITQIGYGQGPVRRVGTIDLAKGPATSLALRQGGQLFAAVGSSEIECLDEKGKSPQRFSIGESSDPSPGLFASPDGKWLYILSGDRLLRAAIPFLERPRIEWVDFLGRPFADRIRLLFGSMRRASDDPRARELVSLGRRAFDGLAEGIENERDDDTVEKFLFLVTLAKAPAYAEKMLALAGKRGKAVDGWIAQYVMSSGALSDDGMRGRFSERFRKTHPMEVFDINYETASKGGSKEAVGEALAALAAWTEIPGGMLDYGRYEGLCLLVGAPAEENSRFVDVRKGIADLASWWTENHDRLKWNAEKRVFEKAP